MTSVSVPEPAHVTTAVTSATTLTLQERLRTIVKQDDPKTWDDAWKAEVTPWEKLGDVQPPLYNLLRSNEVDFPRSGRALVPGCGSSILVVSTAAPLIIYTNMTRSEKFNFLTYGLRRCIHCIYSLETTGLDISETAVLRAEKLLSSREALTDNARFKLGNFFELDPRPEDKFNLIYDYTFFVAIPPSRRGEWGAQMSKLANSGGYLITLVYPINPETDVGPPFFVRVEHYEKVLGDKFVKVLEKTPEESAEGHQGKEKLVVWRRL